MMMAMLATTLPVMAVAALSLHVLLTAITGNQGNATRHAIIILVFVVLSLPLAFAQVFDLFFVVVYSAT
jgi:hypothetical protein